jgi:hypothetical protein
MLSKWSVLLLVGMMASGGLALAADKKEDRVKEELKKLQGTWQAVSVEFNGLKALWEKLAGARFEIKDNKLSADCSQTQEALFAPGCITGRVWP